MTSPQSFPDMISAVTKTFIIAHEQDSDDHLAQSLVYNAGRMAWRMRETGVSTEFKTSVSDLVTDADRGAEQFVSGVLAELRPEDGIIGEEGARRPSTSGRTWIIDPVDGTYNFAAGNDYWCSALALVEGDPADPTKVLIGAVHRPAMGYTWFGSEAQPTTRDGQGVEKLVDAPVDQLCLGTYLHPRFMKDEAIREVWLRVAGEFATLRMLGSASVDLGSVADGTLDVWMQHSVADWDWLPGRALVEGAGGVGRKVEAGGVTWCIAGNAQAVSQVVALLED